MNDPNLIPLKVKTMPEKNMSSNVNPNNIIAQTSIINPWNPMFPGMNILSNISQKHLNNRSVYNNVKLGIEEMRPFSDSVFHISEAMIANSLNIFDKNLMSNEKDYTEAIKNDIIRNASVLGTNIINVPLSQLSSILNITSVGLKRSISKIEAEVCKKAYQRMAKDKNINLYVDNIYNALVGYSKKVVNGGKPPMNDCLAIINAQENLKKRIKTFNRSDIVNEVLNEVFVRAAVDRFYEGFGDLKNPKVISNLKSIFNSINGSFMRIPYSGMDLKFNYNNFCAHYKSLTYGFGFYSSSVDAQIKNLENGNTGPVTGLLPVLMALSKEYALKIKNGKEFEVLNTGSCSDQNCAFRAIAVGAGYGPNGYNIVQQGVVKGAQKVLKKWDGLGTDIKKHIFKALEAYIDPAALKWNIDLNADLDDPGALSLANEQELFNKVKTMLTQYINSRERGFVKWMAGLELMLAAIGLERPICVVNAMNGTEFTFLPNGKMDNGIGDSYFSYGNNQIYIGRIFGHAEALLPLDKEGSQKMKDKLPELDKKAEKVKMFAEKRILDNIITGEFKNTTGFPNDVYAKSLAHLWVETCKNNPLYWDNQFNRRSMSL